MAKVSINIATGSIQQSDMIVGIDLGTTNSLIAMVREDDGVRRPIALRETDGLSLVPSVVFFDGQNQPVVGQAAKAQLVHAPERTIYSAKRLMGKSYKDVAEQADTIAYRIHDEETDALVRVQIGDAFYSPIQLSAFILAELKHRAEHLLKTGISKAVITVPAYFNDTQRQATRDAGRLAGLDVLRIINEPTAAALAYGLGTNATDEKTIAVYDLGGGTFDVSILHLSNGIFEVLSTNGNTWLGGDDMDRAIAEHWAKESGIGNPELAANKSLVQVLRLKAEEAKKHLSANAEFETTLIAGADSESFMPDFLQQLSGKKLSLTRETFETLIRPMLRQTLDACAASLKDAGLAASQIDAVVMVGGSTRVPAVKNAVAEFFGRPVFDELNPDEVVALGAAIQADILAGHNTGMLLLDVTPLSLGIETMGGLMDVLIPRNAKIPTKAGRQYTTQKDGQSGIQIAVYQGERDLVSHNRKLAGFTLSGIPNMPAGLPKVEITFLLDADGILKVSAQELRSGVQASIDVQPQYGLTDAQVEEMLLASLTHAQSDIRERALVEARTEAEQLISTTTSFLSKHATLLAPEEIAKTQRHITSLAALLNTGTKDDIQSLTQALNDASRPYAERVMDEAVRNAMQGKKIV